MKLIVGIDPGTTVGWAVLSLDGKILELGSAKEFSLDKLISKILKLGTVVLVGCDKAKIPSFVQDFASKFHAPVVSPKADLQVSEKRSLTKEFDYSNGHEMDALASALAAWKKALPLLRKIRANVPVKLFDDVCDLVLREHVSIHAALAILTPKPVEKVEETEEPEKDDDLARLYSSLKLARKEANALRRKNEALLRKHAVLQSDYDKLKERASQLVKPKSSRQLSAEKESRIRVLTDKLERKEAEYKKACDDLLELERLCVDDTLFAVPRFERLNDENEAKDIIFVEDPNEFSRKFVDKVRKDVSIVVYGKPPSKTVVNSLPFAFVDSKGVIVRKLDSIVFLDKAELEKLRAATAVLEKVVSEYRKSRVS